MMRSSKKYQIIDGQHRYLALRDKGFLDNTSVTCEVHTSLTESKIVRLRLGDLEVHPQAQKAVNDAHLRRILAGFNVGSLGVISVVDPEVVPLEVASLLFLTLNNRAAIGSFEKFKNRLQSNDPTTVGASNVCADHGLRVQKTAANGAIMCTDAIMRAYGFDKGVSLSSALTTAIAAWGPTKEAVTGRLVASLAEMFRQHPSASTTALAKKLKSKTVAGSLEEDISSYAGLQRTSVANAGAELIYRRHVAGRQI